MLSCSSIVALGIFALPIITTVTAADDLEDEVSVEDVDEVKGKTTVSTSEKDLDEEAAVFRSPSSPDVETSILFTEPVITGKDIPTATIVKLLVGFLNKGAHEFVVESMDVSFRYPMDFSFYIQNYTDATYNRIVPAQSESTFEYSFIPSESYAGRPLLLSINLRYTGTNKTQFVSSVYNETVTLFEDESGFNPETGFLYVVFGCIVVLLLVVGQQFLSKMRKKHGMTKRSVPVEMGTAKNGGVDYDWIPKQLLQPNKTSLTRRELKQTNQMRKDR